MEVGFLQFSPIFGKPDRNLEIIKEILRREKASEVLVLPELALTGYTFRNPEEAYLLGEEIGGPLTRELIRIASEYKIIMAVGFLEKEGKKLYNSSLLLRGDGIKGIYRKVHLFYREKEIFEPGDKGFPVFEVQGVKVGLLLCFDWIFPEAMRTLMVKGVDIILHSANLILPYYQAAAVTRAIENRVYIVLANRTGIEERYGMRNEFTGGSEVVNPQGEVILKVGRRVEGLFSVNINPEKSRNKNITELNNLLEDRKVDQYEGWDNRQPR
ncbi:MAG: nitrilase-related carbon-nitrogen hydrolase [candidate division WOR-3 bacterium]|nr:nitrilase-related carbon-nitrogen hydrolase [candidate division WOR-3 bacterium]